MVWLIFLVSSIAAFAPLDVQRRSRCTMPTLFDTSRHVLRPKQIRQDKKATTKTRTRTTSTVVMMMTSPSLYEDLFAAVIHNNGDGSFFQDHNVQHLLSSSSSALWLSTETVDSVAATSSPPETGGMSYSRASYYTILGLYALSFPGLWSTIKRSTTAKVKRTTFVSPGPNSVGNGRSLRQQAGEIMACK